MVAYAPPTVPAYLLSLLANRLTTLGDAFAGQFDGHWLIWEPGQWSAGGIFEHTKTPHGTRVTGSMGNSLSFHLKARQLLKLGRSQRVRHRHRRQRQVLARPVARADEERRRLGGPRALGRRRDEGRRGGARARRRGAAALRRRAARGRRRSDVPQREGPDAQAPRPIAPTLGAALDEPAHPGGRRALAMGLSLHADTLSRRKETLAARPSHGDMHTLSRIAVAVLLSCCRANSEAVPQAPPQRDVFKPIGGIEGENPGYDAQRAPAALIEALGLKPGQRVADVGAGRGYLTLRLAAAVGPGGHVVATDVDDDALAATLRFRVQGRGDITVRKVAPNGELTARLHVALATTGVGAADRVLTARWTTRAHDDLDAAMAAVDGDEGVQLRRARIGSLCVQCLSRLHRYAPDRRPRRPARRPGAPLRRSGRVRGDGLRRQPGWRPEERCIAAAGRGRRRGDATPRSTTSDASS